MAAAWMSGRVRKMGLGCTVRKPWKPTHANIKRIKSTDYRLGLKGMWVREEERDKQSWMSTKLALFLL